MSFDRCFAEDHAGTAKLTIVLIAKLIQRNAIKRRLSAKRTIPTIQTAAISIKVPKEAKCFCKKRVIAMPIIPPEPFGKG